MIKVGDVVVVIYKDDDLLDGLALCTGENKYLWITQADDNAAGEWEATGTFARQTPYTGPIYERDGRRFVPSGEEPRLPKKGEHYYNETTKRASGPSSIDRTEQSICNDNHKGTRRILLPVPALPDEHGFVGGAWIKDTKDNVLKFAGYSVKGLVVASQCYGSPPHIGPYTKLPGRPLTTDDLMQVLSGKKVVVECHACGCEGVRGELLFDGCHGSLYFSHVSQRYTGYSRRLADFKDGSIAFADGVEGNIYVVDE